HPEAGRRARGVRDLGRMQQRLGGNAALVQAGATHLRLLDESHAQAVLSGAQRTGVPAAPTSEDDEIELLGLVLELRHGWPDVLVWSSAGEPARARCGGDRAGNGGV